MLSLGGEAYWYVYPFFSFCPIEKTFLLTCLSSPKQRRLRAFAPP